MLQGCSYRVTCYREIAKLHLNRNNFSCFFEGFSPILFVLDFSLSLWKHEPLLRTDFIRTRANIQTDLGPNFMLLSDSHSNNFVSVSTNNSSRVLESIEISIFIRCRRRKLGENAVIWREKEKEGNREDRTVQCVHESGGNEREKTKQRRKEYLISEFVCLLLVPQGDFGRIVIRASDAPSPNGSRESNVSPLITTLGLSRSVA